VNKKKVAGLSLGSIIFILLTCCFLSFIVYITTSSKSNSSNLNVNNSGGSQIQEDVKGQIKTKVVQTPVCEQDKLDSKKCSTCKMATGTYLNKDCTKYTKEIEDSTCTNACPKCTQDELTSKNCSSCNRAKGTFKNADCSTYTKEIDDSSCNDLCPKPEPVYQAPAPQPSGYACNCSKTCEQMISCEDIC